MRLSDWSGPTLTGAHRLDPAAPRRRRPGRARASTVVLLGLTALALSGCLSSSYTYISHRNPDQTEVYLKLPDSWKSFTGSQIIEAENGKLSNTQLSQISGSQWVMAFTGAPKATAKQVGNIGNRYPGGVTIARQLSENDRDAFSLSSMRSMILGTDPLSGGSEFNVLSYNEFVLPSGIRGSKLTVDISQASGPVLTFGQVVDVDPGTNWVYALGVGCRAACWGPNQGLINQVLNSFSLKELGR